MMVCAAAEPSRDLPSEWPESWRAGYERFERFRVERERGRRETMIDIEPQGVVWRNPVKNDPGRNVSIELFHRGANAFGITKDIASGDYAACVRFATLLGYQYLPPIIWFRVRVEGERRYFFENGERRFERLSAPEPAGDFWPNERMLAWLDYQILPGGHPADIRSENKKVQPALFLQVDRDGTIHYETDLIQAHPDVLKWHIYRDGKLAHRGPVSPESTFPLADEMGVYQVMAGLDGPNGFFPTSNLLTFVLGPSDDGGSELVFRGESARDPDSPEWFRACHQPPWGTGPERFASEEDADDARNIARFFYAAADLFNQPDAPWVKQPAPDEPAE